MPPVGDFAHGNADVQFNTCSTGSCRWCWPAPAQARDHQPAGKSTAEVAAYFGVKVDKVLFWIHAGELRAINTALKPNGRPRYRILEKDLEDFESHRAIIPLPEKKHHQSSLGLSRLLGVKQYYR